MTFSESLIIELVRWGSTTIVLFMTWGVGQRILIAWDVRKKRQELDIATSSEFQSLYGEFKDIARHWRMMSRIDSSKLPRPDQARWDLLSRACSMESRNEAILMKLATERVFTSGEMKTLGLFRQAFQQLRQAIRDNKEVAASSRGLEYDFFNALAARVASIIAADHPLRPISPVAAVNNLRTIASLTGNDFLQAISSFRFEQSKLDEQDRDLELVE